MEPLFRTPRQPTATTMLLTHSLRRQTSAGQNTAWDMCPGDSTLTSMRYSCNVYVRCGVWNSDSRRVIFGRHPRHDTKRQWHRLCVMLSVLRRHLASEKK